MALDAYVKATGEKQGLFKGGVIQKGREGLIQVISCSHSCESPRDPASGQATGKRRHDPWTFLAAYDQSITMWYQALCMNESLKEVIFSFYSPNVLGKAGGSGVETLSYEIKLTNAFVSKVEFQMLNNKNPELNRYENQFRVSMVYQKIEWTWKAGGSKVAMDDWLEPGK